MQEQIAQKIRQWVDWFYLPFLRGLMPLETFRYAVAGVANLALSAGIYFVSFHYILEKEHFEVFNKLVISGHIMALGIALVVTFFTGFWLTRMVAFDGHRRLRERKQLLRYGQVVAINLAVNYFGLKLLVDVFGFYPTPSYLFIQLLTVAISYLASKYYTFR